MKKRFTEQQIVAILKEGDAYGMTRCIFNQISLWQPKNLDSVSRQFRGNYRLFT